MAKKADNANGYALSRDWFNFALSNPELVTGNHTALYMWLIELNNRLGWVDKFGLTVREGMDGMSCKSRTTYLKCFHNLIEWNFIWMVKTSRNQYEANVISLFNNCTTTDTTTCTSNGITTDTTTCTSNGITTDTTTCTAIGSTTGTIPKTVNNETLKPINNNESKRTSFDPPSYDEVLVFFKEKIPDSNWPGDRCEAEAKKFISFYDSKNWYVGRNKMVKWKSAAAGWIERSKNFNNGTQYKNTQGLHPTSAPVSGRDYGKL